MLPKIQLEQRGASGLKAMWCMSGQAVAACGGQLGGQVSGDYSGCVRPGAL